MKCFSLVVLTLCVFEMEARPCGSWKSPITSSMIVESAIRLGEVVVDGDDLYWSESRPEEKGRSVIVKGGKDILPEPYNARTRVHEYGGVPSRFQMECSTSPILKIRDFTSASEMERSKRFVLERECGMQTPFVIALEM